MTTSTYTQTSSHDCEMFFDLEGRTPFGWVDDDIISKAKDWTAKTQDIIIDKSCVELCFDQVFVGTHVENDIVFESQYRREKRDLKNLEEIREITQIEGGYVPDTLPMVVESISDYTNGAMDYITVNGRRYYYILVVGNHRYYEWIQIWESAPFAIGHFESNLQRNRFGTIKSNEDNRMKLKTYSLADFRSHVALAVEEGAIIDGDYQSLFDYVKEHGRSIKRELDVSWKQLTDKLCGSNFTSPQYTYNKKKIDTDLTYMGVTLKRIKHFWGKYHGSLDGIGRRWYTALATHGGEYGKKGLSTDMTEVINQPNYVPCEHVVVLGFQTIVHETDKVAYRKRKEHEILTYIQQQWKGGAKALGRSSMDSIPQAGFITFAWMATDHKQDTQKLYDAEGFELSL